jgi:hypothetical protein
MPEPSRLPSPTRGSRVSCLAVTVIAVAAAGGTAHAGIGLPPPPTTYVHFHGQVEAYPSSLTSSVGEPVGSGRKVTFVALTYAPRYTDGHGCDVCTVNGTDSQILRTNGSGQFTAYTHTDVYCYAPNTGRTYTRCEIDPDTKTQVCVPTACPASGGVQASAFAEGSESTVGSVHEKPQATAQSTYQMSAIRNAPHYVSTLDPDDRYWARKIGNGPHPIFLIEGFDPGDSHDSNFARWFLGNASLDAWAPAGEGDLLHYLVGEDFTIWLIESGENGGASIAGRSKTGSGAIDDSQGLAYDAMMLIHEIQLAYYPDSRNQKIVIGGYSMGGLVARAGLKKWCSGAWYGLSGGWLAPDCPGVSLWFAGDSPLTGATVPVSLQRYLWDPAVRSHLDAGVAAEVVPLLSSWATRELLRQSLTVGPQGLFPPTCYTGCAPDISIFALDGCSSRDLEFSDGCRMMDENEPAGIHKQFYDWIGSGPVASSNGALIPAVTFSMGEFPTDWGDLCTPQVAPVPDLVDECRDMDDPPSRDDDKSLFLKARIAGADDDNLYVNTAGGTHECDHGSRLSMLSLAKKPFDCNRAVGNVQGVDVTRYPTFVPSTSSLMYDNGHYAHWFKNYWTQAYDLDHVAATGPTLPEDTAGFLAAWIWEYLKGSRTTPMCDAVRTPLGRKAMSCRTSTICGDGICEAGEDLCIDCYSQVIQ